MIKSFIRILFELLKLPVAVIGVMIAAFSLVVFCQVFLMLRQGHKLPKETAEYHRPQKRKGFLWCWFVGTPRQFARDMFTREPGFFKYQGCVIFTGRQGAGKTVAAVEFIRHMQREYPQAKVLTNCWYTGQDAALANWKPLVTYKNGHHGVIAFIDETQNWFSSNQSKNFPPEMLQVVTQNRKNRRIILGTAQCFNRLSKPLREQATEVRECHTWFGCLTFVVRREPVLDSEGNVEKMKFRGMYCFTHDPELRESYDTYRVIDSLVKSGFQPRKEQVPAITVQNFIRKK